MPITAHKLGPGTLTLGAGAITASAQLTGGKVTAGESVTTTDAVKVLSGEELAASERADYSFAMEGNFLQDLGAVAGVVQWSWDNMGTEQPFSFTPNTVAGVTVAGTLIPVPLDIGGDGVEADNMASDFTWRIVGTPTLS